MFAMEEDRSRVRVRGNMLAMEDRAPFTMTKPDSSRKHTLLDTIKDGEMHGSIGGNTFGPPKGWALNGMCSSFT
jgi:hypothetical protein